MLFKIDENLPEEVGELLRSQGHDAATVFAQGMSGDPDSKVAEACRREGRIIVSLDVGFADIRRYRPSEYAGILLLRVGRQDTAHLLAVVGRLLPALSVEDISGRLWVVDETSIRVRAD